MIFNAVADRECIHFADLPGEIGGCYLFPSAAGEDRHPSNTIGMRIRATGVGSQVVKGGKSSFENTGRFLRGGFQVTSWDAEVRCRQEKGNPVHRRCLRLFQEKGGGEVKSRYPNGRDHHPTAAAEKELGSELDFVIPPFVDAGVSAKTQSWKNRRHHHTRTQTSAIWAGPKAKAEMKSVHMMLV